ncbi:MAG: cupredoxin domain-containing protein [Gemmatimonas sp.]
MRRAIEVRDRKTYGWKAAASALIAITALAAGTVAAADAVQVSQRNRTFSPDSIQIDRGTVVRIVNDDRVTHHIYVDTPGMSFDSGEQPIGHTVELRFDRAGTFDVMCAIHPTMRLRVTVK